MTWQKGLTWAGLILIAWPIQYLLVVPAVILWRVIVVIVRFALKLGLIGIVLLFLPIIGWAILAAWLLFRRPDRQGEILAELRLQSAVMGAYSGTASTYTPPRRSIFTPWQIERVR